MILRFKYKKYGPVIYIGHLDVMRTFQKIIRRSGINASYTGGFSPHLKLSFAQPLSVGVETDGDYFDLEMNSLPDMKNLVKLMNSQCVEGIEVVSATILDDDAQNGMSSVKAAKYLFEYSGGLDSKKRILSEFFAKDSYVFEHEIKGEKKTRDIMPDIYSYEYIDDKTISVMVNCSSGGNLKAFVVSDALNHFGLDCELIKYKRLDLYTEINCEYVELSKLGEVYD